MDEIVLIVYNAHIASCGKPPGMVTEAKHYISYFVDAQGDQFVFRFEWASGNALLWCGDYSWEHPVRVTERGYLPIIVGEEVRLWLRACGKAIEPHWKYLQESGKKVHGGPF